jgi:hypothetical protein
MANIPVEKKSSGMPWWVWLLLLLLLGLLIWFLIEAFTEDEVYEEPYEDPQEEVVMLPPMDQDVYTGTITDLNTLVEADGVAAVAGRQVDLDGIRVRSLTGDSTFVVSPMNADDRFLVVMRNMQESETGDGTGMDGIHNIDEGDMISIMGMVVDPSMMPREAWGMDSGDMRDAFYIRANSLDKM